MFDKVDNPYSVIFLTRTPIWVVCGLVGYKNGHQKDTCSKEIGPHAQNMMTIPGSIVNIIGGDLYDHLMSTRIFILIKQRIFIQALNKYENSGCASIWIC